MVGRIRRGSRRRGQQDLLGSHQKCWLWGRHAVTETLTAGRWLPIEIVLSSDLGHELHSSVIEKAESRNVPVRIEDPARLTQLSGARDHQGLLAKMPPYPYADPAAAIADASKPAFFLILDAIQDPFNFGAICRVACVFGVDAVFIGSQSQVEVTSQVARSSAGAVNRLTICRVDDLTDLAEKLGLNPTQVNDLREHTLAIEEKRQAMFAEARELGEFGSMRENMRTLREESNVALQGIFTPSQYQQYTDENLGGGRGGFDGGGGGRRGGGGGGNNGGGGGGGGRRGGGGF